MMKKMLFIASLPNKAHYFDGERNKSRDVLNALFLTNKYKIKTIDYTKNKYLQTIKMLLLLLFIKIDCIFISKCLVGGSTAVHIIKTFFGRRYKNKIYFYLIGNGAIGHDGKKIYKEDMSFCKHIIYESPQVIKDLDIKTDSSVFACIKPNFNIGLKTKKYKKGNSLNLIFFSRIHPDKGLDDAINAVLSVNNILGKNALYLDIAGGVSNKKETIDYSKRIIEICNKHDCLNYLELSLRIEGESSYFKLQKYDLHLFPSKFAQECAPGSVIDMFIAGVPTLSSNFPSSRFIMNDENSFFFEQGNVNDLVAQLLFIYNNPNILESKRELSYLERLKYNYDEFLNHLNTIGL